MENIVVGTTNLYFSNLTLKLLSYSHITSYKDELFYKIKLFYKNSFIVHYYMNFLQFLKIWAHNGLHWLSYGCPLTINVGPSVNPPNLKC